MDLGAGMPIIQGSSGSFVSPEGDPVCIEVSVRGIPLLARVSNRSLYTIVGESVFEQLRLTRLESLQTNKLVNTLNAKRLKKLSFTCLAPFTLKMGVIEVTLRNAIMLSPDPCGEMFGNQLGHDFLSSGTWLVPNTVDGKMEIENELPFDSSSQDDTWMRVDGEYTWGGGLKSPRKCFDIIHTTERLRMFRCFISVHLFEPTSLVFHAKRRQSWINSFWYYRVFPEGMLVCPVCDKAGEIDTYCYQRCQQAAFKIH
jgi:hypothetical protein